MHVEPQVEHNWLENLLGEWTLESEADMSPDMPKQTSVGIELVRKLGDVWVLCEMELEMPGGDTAKSQMTLGYDPQAKSFVGSFISSCMCHLWIYSSGTLDDAGKVLTLDATGPSFSGEGMSQYQDVIEIVDEDHRILHARLLDENEVWQEFMTTRYTRKK
ncbi:hypothetical protein Pan97_43730 [Bremerella volcania]|uniref:THAP4-like heme-binding beta-barrel domain-containing protein n=1 Tax=Bremerella volcania TaxID=2527984 RepID=A0A518CDJ9_9BACT|nr:DUF1579 domain-containing protein [Bremerella volcania]QDU77306.1 hypothetical protein Pan97_43730 [Bremerella volcania]